MERIERICTDFWGIISKIRVNPCHLCKSASHFCLVMFSFLRLLKVYGSESEKALQYVVK